MSGPQATSPAATRVTAAGDVVDSAAGVSMAGEPVGRAVEQGTRTDARRNGPATASSCRPRPAHLVIEPLSPPRRVRPREEHATAFCDRGRGYRPSSLLISTRLPSGSLT